MSSLVRRIEIRILKARGYVRQTKKVSLNQTTGTPEIVACKHGNIINPEGVDTLSPVWPTNPKARLARNQADILELAA